MMHLLNDFYKEMHHKYNIFVVYISEAHAADVWNIGESAGAINYSHKEIKDRVSCSLKFKDEFKLSIPIYCDNMQDEFETKFACWPVRYFVIIDGKLSMISEPSDSEVDICALFRFLSERNKQTE
jgi:hypothetical protein